MRAGITIAPGEMLCFARRAFFPPFLRLAFIALIPKIQSRRVAAAMRES
jgi:hypothetical protein